MKLPRIVIAAPRSGSGKTLISMAMMKAFSMQGKNVAAFKCGPDYIDPMFHRKILGVPSRNLDLFFTDAAMTRSLFMSGNNADISIIEGVMGLYDGLAGYTDEASTYALAEAIEAPVLLVVNTKGMGRSILAEIKGFLAFDRSSLIKGVILNNLPEMLYGKMKELVEVELGIKVAGFFPPQKDLQLESRYLGLKLPDEITDIQGMAEKAGEALSRTVDLDAVLKLAESADELPEVAATPVQASVPQGSVRVGVAATPVQASVPQGSVRVGVAQDPAFCFYYDDNLRLLEQAGAELVPFSPLSDLKLPDNISGLLLGGGYPELFAPQLASNKTMLSSIKAAIDGGIPSLAECGGFMYLHETLVTQDGVSHKLVGAVKGECSYKGKLVRFGYVTLMPPLNRSTEDEAAAPEGESWCGAGLIPAGGMKAHEFHYFDSTANGSGLLAEKPVTGRSWECCHTSGGRCWGFPHLYYPSAPEFAENFLMACRNYSRKS